MQLDLKAGIIGLTEFARNTRQQTEELVESGQPRVLTHNGRAALVVMSIDAFQDLAADAEERQLDLELQQALEDYAKGARGRPMRDVLGEIRKERAKAK